MLKRYPLALFVFIPALILSACSASAADNAATYTAVAKTIFAAQTASAPLTPTLLSTLSPVPQTSPTLTRTGLLSPSATRSPIPNIPACDNSAFVSDITIPDGTPFAPGDSFTKTWSIRNTGTCNWTTSYALVFLSGSAMDGSTTKLSDSVDAGDAVNVSVGMVAPKTAGTYTGYWRMQNAAGTFFGEPVFVKIVVSSGTGTVTPTPSATKTGSSHTSTPTPSPSNTFTPTEVPSNTPTPETPTEISIP